MLLVLFQPKVLTPTVQTQLKAPTLLALQLVNLQLKTPTTPTPLPQLLLFNAPALPTLALVAAAALLQLKTPTTLTPLPLLLFPNLPTIALVVTAAVVFQLKALTTPTLPPPTVQLLLIQLKAPTTHTPLPLLPPFNAPTLHTLALVIAAAAVISQHLFLPLQVLDLILLTHAMLYLLCSYAAYMP